MRIYGVILLPFLFYPVNSIAADYTTEETVRFVLNCMAELGAQSDENLYTCICKLDVIAASMPFEEYEQATFFERYSDMPGKRGGLVRDSEHGDVLKGKLKEARAAADTQCRVVKHIQRAKITEKN